MPRKRTNGKIVVKPVPEDQLREMGKILMLTWGGFIRSTDVTEKRVGPYLSANLEQPFMAYLNNRPVGCVSPRMDSKSRIGILDGGVHVLFEHRRQRIGTTLLLVALKWLRDNGMKATEVTPFNPEGESAVQRATAFYLANGGKISEGSGSKKAPKPKRKDKTSATTFKSLGHSL